jgi:beta-N-acetylhexosaminidase
MKKNLPHILFLLLSLLGADVASSEPLSLRDKIAQMIVIGFEGKQVDEQSPIAKSIQQQHIGGVILFDYHQSHKNFDNNIESPVQVKRLTSALQHINEMTHHHHHHLPLLISVDYEGGERGTRLNPRHGFPKTMSAANVAANGVENANQTAEQMADTMQQAGLNLNFAPVVDVNVNPDSPIIGKVGRSFSENPEEVVTYATIFSEHYRKHQVQCAYKHFPGHGSATLDSHLGFVDVSDTWQARELEPYSQLFKQNGTCGVVMTAHLVNRQLDETGVPATLSYAILTELLRHKLQFKGVVITDDLQMKAIADHYSLDKAVLMAVNAGADMLLFGNQLSDRPQDPKEVIDLIESKVRTGEISEQRIDAAYQHIVALKDTIQ